MVIALIGESCTGKSTVAEELSQTLECTIYSGKDYLKLAKSEAEAIQRFKNMLEHSEDQTILYLITESNHLSLLPDHAYRIVLTAELDVIKERFARRLRRETLPQPIASMLEHKHGMFDNIACDRKLTSLDAKSTVQDILKQLKQKTTR